MPTIGHAADDSPVQHREITRTVHMDSE